jgi:hypothetical protein
MQLHGLSRKEIWVEYKKGQIINDSHRFGEVFSVNSRSESEHREGDV